MNKLVIIVLVVLAFINPALAEDKNDAWSKSYTLESKGEYEKAAALLVPLTESGDNTEFALLRYGWLNYLLGNYNDAIKTYKRALKRNARSIDARLGVSLPLMAQGRWKEASRYLIQVLETSPFHYLAHIRLMACEEGLRNWLALERHGLNLSAYYPSDGTILIYLARSYVWQDKQEDALKIYHKVIARFPSNSEALNFLNRPNN